MREKAFLAVVIASSASCTLPERDNPTDPLNAPDAAFQVVTQSPAGNGCLGLPEGGWNRLAVVSRGQCIALDARGSTDPQGDALSYAFRLQDGDGWGDPLPPETFVAVTATGALAVLDPGWVRTLPVPGLSEFQVTVSDEEDGGERTAVASIGLENARPVAIGDAPRSYPVGGFAWAPGESVEVTFDCGASFDLDGDPLDCCWTFDDGTAPATECVSPPETRIVRTFDPSIERTITATLVVDDRALPELASLPARSRVTFGDVPLWTASAPGDTYPYLVQLDDARTATHLLNERFVAWHAGEDGEYLIAPRTFKPVLDDPDRASIRVYGWPYEGGDPVDEDDTTFFGYPHDFVIRTDPSAQRFWVLAESEADPSGQLLASYEVDGGALVLLDSIELTLPRIASEQGLTLAGDTIWVSRGSAMDVVVDGPGGLSVDPADRLTTGATSLHFRGAAAHLGRSDVWTVVAPRNSSSGEASLVAYDAASRAEVARVPLGSESVPRIAFATPELLWLFLDGEGFYLLDADLVAAIGFSGEAVVLHVPSVDAVRMMAVDASDGSVWASTTGPEELHLHVDGQQEVFSSGGWNVETLDGRGLVLFRAAVGTNRAFSGRSSSERGVLTSLPKLSSAHGQLLPGGLLWSQFASEGRVDVFAPGGRRVARIQRALVDGAESQIGFNGTHLVSADGQYVWAVTSGSLRRWSIREGHIERTATDPFFALEGMAGSADDRPVVLGSPARIPGIVWALFGTRIPDDGVLRAFDESGQELSAFPVPPSEDHNLRSDVGNEDIAVFASSPSSGRLCVGTVREDGVAVVRWLPDPDDVVSPVTVSTAATMTSVPAASRGSRPGAASVGPDESCWLAWYDKLPNFSDTCEQGPDEQGSTYVVAVSSAGVRLRESGPIDGIVTGLHVRDADEAWLTVYRCGLEGDYAVRLEAQDTTFVVTTGGMPTGGRGLLP